MKKSKNVLTLEQVRNLDLNQLRADALKRIIYLEKPLRKYPTVEDLAETLDMFTEKCTNPGFYEGWKFNPWLSNQELLQFVNPVIGHPELSDRFIFDLKNNTVRWVDFHLQKTVTRYKIFNLKFFVINPE